MTDYKSKLENLKARRQDIATKDFTINNSFNK